MSYSVDGMMFSTWVSASIFGLSENDVHLLLMEVSLNLEYQGESYENGCFGDIHIYPPIWISIIFDVGKKVYIAYVYIYITK